VVGGVAWTLAHGPHLHMHAGLWHPALAITDFDRSTLWSALGLLVVPQLPLTFGNAVVGVTRLEHEYFPTAAHRVTDKRVGLSCGLANVVVGALGGMPMCHGSSGLTAHVRAGARTARMNLVIGVPLLLAGLLAGPAIVPLLGLVPLAVLAGMLAFTGLMHAGLATQLRGYPLLVAATMGVVGVATGNLAWSLLVGLVLHWAPVGAAALDSARSAPPPPTGA
jgi:SulP family sulfate permease